MFRPYAEQRKETFIVQVGAVSFEGKGKWTDIPLPQRRELVKHLIAANIALDCEGEASDENQA